MTIALDSTNNSELITRLEEAALNGLPALQTEFYDGWVVRMAEGYSRRANCVVPLYESTTPLQEKLVQRLFTRIRTFESDNGIKLFQVRGRLR